MKIRIARLGIALFFVQVLGSCARPAVDITHAVLGGLSPSTLVVTSDATATCFEIPLSDVEKSSSPLRDAVRGDAQIAIDGVSFHRWKPGPEDSVVYASDDFRKQMTFRIEAGVLKGGVVVSW